MKNLEFFLSPKIWCTEYYVETKSVTPAGTISFSFFVRRLKWLHFFSCCCQQCNNKRQSRANRELTHLLPILFWRPLHIRQIKDKGLAINIWYIIFLSLKLYVKGIPKFHTDSFCLLPTLFFRHLSKNYEIRKYYMYNVKVTNVKLSYLFFFRLWLAISITKIIVLNLSLTMYVFITRCRKNTYCWLVHKECYDGCLWENIFICALDRKFWQKILYEASLNNFPHRLVPF